MRQQRLSLALLISLLLHLSVMVAPGWLLPLDEDLPVLAAPLEASLQSLPLRREAKPVAAPAPRRQPLRRAVPPVFSEPAAAPVEPSVPEPPSVPASAAAALAPPPMPPQLGAGEDPAARPGAAPVMQRESVLPRQGRIRFNISRGDQGFIIGQALHRWSHDGKRYMLSSVTETTGLAAIFKPARVMQTSEGEIDAAGLHPGEFRTERNGSAGDAASFDWTGMKLKLSGGSQREVPLVSGAQDMLSMFYQLGAVFPGVPQETKEIMVATGRKFERYPFEVVREERLMTRQGEMRTLHLRTAVGIEAIDVWVGLELRGLPLKIKYTDRQGESFEQNAEEIEFDSMPSVARSP